MFQKCPYLQLPFTELSRSIEVKWQRKSKSHSLKILLIWSCIGILNCCPQLPMRVSKLWKIEFTVLVTGKDFEHLLGVPVALKGTGEQMAEVVIREVDRFGLRDNIIGISFDTTASNTGLIQWACTKIEREFNCVVGLPSSHP
ncbi:hypothetical protein AVEN_25230-1 [Araneus ventricosus]|uniref:DUF659 domain-containing protein n=1 Tax=Araneus ventricosus TaxID=182803 RepID=A0A4Y2M2Y7_ARAVE|nr:hypothetical protein AVEN_25230-1 [Araneus ventricosus]